MSWLPMQVVADSARLAGPVTNTEPRNPAVTSAVKDAGSPFPLTVGTDL